MRNLVLAVLIAATAPWVALAQNVSGGVGLSFGSMTYGNEDDNENGNTGQIGADAFVTVTRGDWHLSFDANIASRELPSGVVFRDTYPESALSYGVHVGRSHGPTYLGIFFGQSRFQGSDSGLANGYVQGELYGSRA